ncbi:MAG: hypothetical protein Q9219_002945 [cf. Caloplaca sp. 3 TL-2023]
MSQDDHLQAVRDQSGINSAPHMNEDADRRIDAQPYPEDSDDTREGDAQDERDVRTTYPYNDPLMEGNALIGPEKWGSLFSGHLPKADSNTSISFGKVSAAETTQSVNTIPEKRPVKKPAPSGGSASIKKISDTEQPLPPARHFQLTVAKSILAHQAHIERQSYYAGFNPDLKTIMAEDLKGRAPLEGLLDCSLNKKEVPLRVRLRKKETQRPPISLMDWWERGRQDRGEV